MKEVAAVVIIVVAVVYGLHKFSGWFYDQVEKRVKREADELEREKEPWGV